MENNYESNEEKTVSLQYLEKLVYVQQLLQARNALLHDIIDSIPVGLAIYQISPEGVETLAVNDMLVRFGNSAQMGVDSKAAPWTKETLQKAFEQDLFTFAVDEDRHIVKKMLDSGLEKGLAMCDFRLRGSAGKHTVWISSRCLTKIQSETVRTVYVLFEDITKEIIAEEKLKKQREKLEYLSYYDTLTGVHNRNYYNQYMDMEKNHVLNNAGVIFVDLNGLKEINDRYGHQYGDKAINRLGEVLRKYFSIEQVFRISGDEFVVLEADIPMKQFDEKTGQFVRELDAEELASVGIIWEPVIQDLQQAIYKAEQLMYIQKQRYYSRHKENSSRHRPQVLNMLLDDLSNGRYVVYLQPKAKISGRTVTGAEALIRKVDGDGKVILPYEFVPLLEKERLISKIDFFVLEEICKLLKRWEWEKRRMVKISVNMSRITLAEDDFLDHVKEICERYNVNSRYLEFEITESIETQNDRLLQKIITELTSKGFGISLDDMGSDYSSLKMLPITGIDTVKMDRSMILRMDTQEGYVMVKHVIAMCHELGEVCIAEGVEDEAQREVLQQLGCDYYQGYLLDRPIPIEEFEKYL